jgi:hypothetical protein
MTVLILSGVPSPATSAAGTDIFHEVPPGAGSAPGWTEMKPASPPPARDGHAMAYDSGSDRVIVFGCLWRNDTWAYDYESNTWREMRPARAPSSKLGCAMAYDSGADRMILFGAPYAQNATGETWSYDYERDEWSNLSPKVSPPARIDHAMAYDSRLGRVILFGGAVPWGGALADTWAFDHANDTWTDLKPASAPSPRDEHAMAYDSESGVTVLFGGGTNYRDTWVYHSSNNTWRQMSPPLAGTPLGRIKHAMTYSSRSDHVLLFGGYIIGGGGARDETHLYDYNNDTWIDPDPQPKPKWSQQPGLAYDSQSDRTIEFGGIGYGDYNDTWAFLDAREGPPSVVGTSPADGAANVSAGSAISITFSTGMATANTEAAIASAPAASGKFSWSTGDATVSLRPSAALQFSTKYTVTVGAGARSKGGTPMASSYSFSFTTESRPPPAPKVTSTDPAGGATGVAVPKSIAITFDQEMDRASTEGAISLAPAAPGSFTWDPAEKSVTLDPASDLSYSTAYAVNVAASARSKAGAALASAHSFSFSTEGEPDTKPPLIDHAPPGPVTEGTAVEIVATVSDDRSLLSVRLHYSSGGMPSMKAIPMVRVSGDRFRAVVPGIDIVPASLDYFIEAADADGNRGTSPEGAPSSLHSVEVIPEAAPPAVKPDWGWFWMLVAVMLAVVAGGVAVGSARRRRKCRWCGSAHEPSAGCAACPGGW